ncbi:MAG: hypothetical protein J6D47_02070 [Peptostreptococcaceae bacterium]|nr:hypothetical protein [Peptostreptococcaceae bacterium]
MQKKSTFYVMAITISVIMIILSQFVELNSHSGILLGTGAGVLGANIAKLYFISLEKKNPDMIKENEIELQDERNVLIRQRAKAKSADITQWLIMIIAYLEIFVNAPLWIILLTVGIFVLYNIIQIYYINKFNKEM